MEDSESMLEITFQILVGQKKDDGPSSRKHEPLSNRSPSLEFCLKTLPHGGLVSCDCIVGCDCLVVSFVLDGKFAQMAACMYQKAYLRSS